ncbi:OsmC family protein [Alteromonas lipolytica]|uniref:OsmC family peroxiredoxin n=1 Tax=Alteromonas lipolytica TaxID=1856405 RepID=A0A1E8FK52_9ALTE|nr:OsmC family protein [Alteromonas lipolytica]OFI36329.1 OsmC family peroxiredoxin [Alteromonas lipolytica]GGF70772.1 peroxiredoxin [Alteromonas lipolytica]
MSIVKSASAYYKPLGKAGLGKVSTQSGALKEQPYGFNTRFEDEPGTNPEELLGAAHASCFAMALSFALADAGFEHGELSVEASVSLDKDGDGFSVTQSALVLDAVVDGIEPAQFAEIADGAKQNCPISKVLNAEITLSYTLNKG